MPIAKETLRLGWVIVARPGAYVSQSTVDEYGWGDKVEKGKDVEASGDDERAGAADAATDTTTKKAAKK